MTEAIVSVIVGRLTDLMIEEANLLYEVRDDIELVVTELRRMMTFLSDADSRIHEERVGILIAQVRDLVYDAEDVAETFLLKVSSSERHKTQGGFRNKVKGSLCVFHDYAYHHKFNREIKCIQTRIQNLFSCFRDYNITSTLEGQGSSTSSSYETPPNKLKRFCSYTVVEPDIFVGMPGEVEKLVGHLVNESDDCYPVILISGMGGLGKTTLARKIYNNSTIKTHFLGLAWVSISQKWQPRAVLQRILISLVHEKKEEILHMEVDKLVEKLLQIQQMKICLIVLDDIWSEEAWNSLKDAFPTENCRSRLLLTSRNVDVADHLNRKCLIHKPRVLDAEQSWELLRLKALPKREYLGNHFIILTSPGYTPCTPRKCLFEFVSTTLYNTPNFPFH